ncbi:hypothetical protein [Streptomyces asiaticus]|uniref:Uncharacterized protein n=2 Tax=Streptomyces rhizosphaericus TaxID=114699 RepID=A0ABN1S022_9ACTN
MAGRAPRAHRSPAWRRSRRLPNGQLVCTLARAQSFLHRDESIRPDDVRVSLDDGERTAGPYQCSQFLT